MGAASAPQTTAELCERFGTADDLTVTHKLPYIDEAAARFLAQCPFVIVAPANDECGMLNAE